MDSRRCGRCGQVTAFQRQRADARAQQLSRPQGSLFDGFADDDDAAAAERAKFRRTEYATIAPFLDVMSLPGGLWVEPCAGDGDLIRHVERWRREAGVPPVTLWYAVELRTSPALRALAEEMAPRLVVFDATDFLTWSPPDSRDRIGCAVTITNWPWYGWEPLASHAFAVFKHAHVVGLSCTRELLDGDRPDWHHAHPADQYVCHGRQRFDAATGYPHPVAWFHWPPGARQRNAGTWRILPEHKETA